MNTRIARALAALGTAAALVILLAGCPRQPPPPVRPDDEVEAGPPFFEDVTKACGIDATYRDGQEAGYYAILESLGGGVALFDFDGDGLLDIFIPGGGFFDKAEKDYPQNPNDDKVLAEALRKAPPGIKGHPGKL